MKNTNTSLLPEYIRETTRSGIIQRETCSSSIKHATMRRHQIIKLSAKY